MNKKVLLVDYEQDYRSTLMEALKPMGFDVFATADPVEALTLAQINGIDIAVIDCLRQNDDTGFVLAYRLRKQYPLLPVILVSSVSTVTGISFNSESERERKWLNADVFLNKDISVETVLKEIFRLLRIKK
ncbi:MAG: response regulator [Bacteroidales bacterium]|nr:response regulator [Bacteroidales bacterium]HPO64787.1 response regulator [Bacteroidales bacterium]